MRIAYGMVLLADVLNRTNHFDMHYTNRGALGLETTLRVASAPGDFSLHLVNGTPVFTALLFVVHAMACVSLMVGFRTRTSTIVCWLLFNSLQDRNFAILNGGDNWLRLILLWAIFLPWGHRWSVDSLTVKPSLPGRTASTVTSVACFAYMLQEFTVYFISAVHKTGPAWRVDGTSAYRALQLNEWGGAWDWFPLYFPELLKWSSLGIFAWEVIAPLLLFTPFFRGPVVSLVAASFVAFHFTLICFMTLGMFPFIGMASALGLLQPWAWERWPLKKLEAWLDQLRYRDWAFTDYAHRLKKWASRPPEPFPHRAWRWVIALALSYGFFWNLCNLKVATMPAWARTAGTFVNLNQNWALFAPEPPVRTGWMVVQGIFPDGSTVDLIGDVKPSTLERPKVPADKYITQREKRWYVVLGNPDYERLQHSYCLYQFRRWAQDYPNEPQLTGINLIWLNQETTPDYEDRPVTYSILYKTANPYR